MSLKAFHIVFVGCSVVLCGGFAWWCVNVYQAKGGAVYLCGAAGSVLAAGALVAYGVMFYRKIGRMVSA